MTIVILKADKCLISVSYHGTHYHQIATTAGGHAGEAGGGWGVPNRVRSGPVCGTGAHPETRKPDLEGEGADLSSCIGGYYAKHH
jgi:hypothetical protein